MSAPPCVERVNFEEKHLHFRLTSGRVKSGELTREPPGNMCRYGALFQACACIPARRCLASFFKLPQFRASVFHFCGSGSGLGERVVSLTRLEDRGLKSGQEARYRRERAESNNVSYGAAFYLNIY